MRNSVQMPMLLLSGALPHVAVVALSVHVAVGVDYVCMVHVMMSACILTQVSGCVCLAGPSTQVSAAAYMLGVVQMPLTNM